MLDRVKRRLFSTVWQVKVPGCAVWMAVTPEDAAQYHAVGLRIRLRRSLLNVPKPKGPPCDLTPLKLLEAAP